MIEFNFTRRQSEVSLNVEKDCNSNPVSVAKCITGGRKPVQRSYTYTPKDVVRINKPHEVVTLPDRYRWKVRRKSNCCSVGNLSLSSMTVLENIDEEGGFEFSDLWEDRKKDMEQAIKWAKQELTNMKRQDKVLKKRLLEIEATIQHLRGISSCPSLAQSRSSISSGASWLSLDDGSLANRREKDNILDFRARMVAEFQKSRPNLNLQSRTVSLFNVKSVVEDSKQDTSSSTSSVMYLPSCSSYSGEDDEKYSDKVFVTQESLDSLPQALLYDSLDDIPHDEKLDESDSFNLSKTSLSSANDFESRDSISSSSSSNEDAQSYEDSTLTKDSNIIDKTMTDSLEDILSSISTKEEREGVSEDDDDDDVEYMV